MQLSDPPASVSEVVALFENALVAAAGKVKVCPVRSCPVLSCLVLPCSALSCPVLSGPVHHRVAYTVAYARYVYSVAYASYTHTVAYTRCIYEVYLKGYGTLRRVAVYCG